MFQVVQIAGSLLVLFGFLGAQRGWFGQRSRVYLAVNAIGSTTLAIAALVDRQWGFLLLEGVWAVVSMTSFRNRRQESPSRRR